MSERNEDPRWDDRFERRMAEILCHWVQIITTIVKVSPTNQLAYSQQLGAWAQIHIQFA
jgi:hypothetical protein